MPLQSWIVLLGIAAIIAMLAANKIRPGMIMFSVVIVLTLCGIISSGEALSGFSNKGMITVAVLFIVSEGVRRSGVLNNIMVRMLPIRRSKVKAALIKILPPVGLMSAFLNNTAVMVILAPIIRKWSEMVHIPPTKFLIPLSYIIIAGGLCTLIGTSTNLVVHGMMLDSGLEGFSMFELGKVGIFILLTTFIYLMLFANRILNGLKHNKSNGEKKKYYFQVYIPEGSFHIGQKIENGTIESMPDTAVTSIKRDGISLDLSSEKEIVIHAGDNIVLIGEKEHVDSFMDSGSAILNCLRNASPDFIKRAHQQVEVLIGARFPGINKTLAEFDLCRHYNAAVISVSRQGAQITEDLEDFVLQEGDDLVLLTDESFITCWGQSTNFLLVSNGGDMNVRLKNKRREWATLALLVFMILGAALGEIFTGNGLTPKLDMFIFASVTALVMVFVNIVPVKGYTKYIHWDILITIACAFAISKAITNSGMADVISGWVLNSSLINNPLIIMAIIYIITNFFTQIITNNAAAALSFPIAFAIATKLGVDPKPFCVAICVAASASFVIPISYQTNLIAMNLANYKFKDFIKIGLPLSLLIFVISIVLIPLFFSY